jgi:hypothetical protein
LSKEGNPAKRLLLAIIFLLEAGKGGREGFKGGISNS